jgi:Flp pilus assembly protein TadG
MLTSRARDERGMTLVTVLLFLPVLILFLTFVIDMGNWFEHKRHLQLQADAAAFAGADSFNTCPSTALIKANADNYSGAISSSQFNKQVGGTPDARMKILYNSDRFYGQSSPVDSTVRNSNGSTSSPNFCADGMVDVKLTENDVPWFFKATGIVPHINAHARVSVFQETTAKGALPVAVPDPSPKAAKAIIVDETTSPATVLGSAPLQPDGSLNGFTIWDNATSAIPVTVPSSHVGVRIVLSDGTSTTCGQPLVACYDANNANLGVLHIDGYSSTAGTAASPVAKAVSLTGTCSNADASFFYSTTASCSIGVSANVDFGTNDPIGVLGARLRATINGSTQTLNFANGTWTSGAVFSIPPQAGPLDVTLDWAETKKGGNQTQTCSNNGGGFGTGKNGNPCQGSFGTVQRTYSGNDTRSGPLRLVQALENGQSFGNALQRGTAHNIVVRIGVQPNLKNAQSANDAPVSLRVAGGGSQNQSLDCDPNISNLKGELAQGCGLPYTLNTGTACTGGYGPGPPYMCVPTQTGNAINQVPDGLNTRLFGTANATASDCTKAPNHWSSYPNFTAGDPRIIQVFLTPFGTFTGSGNESFPVTGFATFYLTGYAGNGNQGDPCTGDDPAQGGFIVGHFIKYIDVLNNGSGGTTTCDFTSLGTCVAVLTE